MTIMSQFSLQSWQWYGLPVRVRVIMTRRGSVAAALPTSSTFLVVLFSANPVPGVEVARTTTTSSSNPKYLCHICHPGYLSFTLRILFQPRIRQWLQNDVWWRAWKILWWQHGSRFCMASKTSLVTPNYFRMWSVSLTDPLYLSRHPNRCTETCTRSKDGCLKTLNRKSRGKPDDFVLWLLHFPRPASESRLLSSMVRCVWRLNGYGNDRESRVSSSIMWGTEVLTSIEAVFRTCIEAVVRTLKPTLGDRTPPWPPCCEPPCWTQFIRFVMYEKEISNDERYPTNVHLAETFGISLL